MNNNIINILKKEKIRNNNIENLLYKHLELVLQLNKKQNLTRISTFEEGKLLHIEDSLVPIHYILCNFDIDQIQYADLGSGAGFPGIPLAITCGLKTSLIETKTKKTLALKEIIKKLDITNIKVINLRIEEAVKQNNEYDLLTARALASLSSLLELASPICKIGGQLICYKSIKCDKEIKEASKIEETFGFKKTYCKDYILSDNKTKRRIIAYNKIKDSSIKLPRKLGIAQKRPYRMK